MAGAGGGLGLRSIMRSIPRASPAPMPALQTTIPVLPALDEEVRRAVGGRGWLAVEGRLWFPVPGRAEGTTWGRRRTSLGAQATQ